MFRGKLLLLYFDFVYAFLLHILVHLFLFPIIKLPFTKWCSKIRELDKFSKFKDRKKYINNSNINNIFYKSLSQNHTI